MESADEPGQAGLQMRLSKCAAYFAFDRAPFREAFRGERFDIPSAAVSASFFRAVSLAVHSRPECMLRQSFQMEGRKFR